MVSAAQDVSTSSPSPVCAPRRQATKKYAELRISSGMPEDAPQMKEAHDAMPASLVLVHEALLYKSAVSETSAQVQCQKALLLINRRDLAGCMHPRLYEMGRARSIS